MNPTSIRVVVGQVASAALAAAGVTMPLYTDKADAPADTDPAPVDGYISVDWTGVGRQSSIASGLEAGFVGPTFRVFSPRAAGDGVATRISGVIARAFRDNPHLPAPAGDKGELYYQSSIPCQEEGPDKRQLYLCDTVILLKNYDPD